MSRADRWNSVNRLSWIGPYLIRKGRTTEGIEVIERWVELQPKSTSALHELAKAYEGNNQIVKAIAAMTKAHQLAMKQELASSKQFMKFIEELKKKID